MKILFFILTVTCLTVSGCISGNDQEEAGPWISCACPPDAAVIMIAGQSNANLGCYVPGYCVKHIAPGGTSLAESWAPGARFYNRMLDCIGSSEPEAIVWVQGEADAQVKQFAIEYESNLIAWIGNVRGDLDYDVAIMVVELGSDAFPFGGAIRDAQRTVAENVAGVDLIETQGITMIDGVHYDAVGRNQICDIIKNETGDN